MSSHEVTEDHERNASLLERARDHLLLRMHACAIADKHAMQFAASMLAETVRAPTVAYDVGLCLAVVQQVRRGLHGKAAAVEGARVATMVGAFNKPPARHGGQALDRLQLAKPSVRVFHRNDAGVPAGGERLENAKHRLEA